MTNKPATTSSPGQATPPHSVYPPVNLTVTADGALLVLLALAIVWKNAIKPTISQRLNSFLIPPEEDRRISTILAQISVITNADRVVLAAFHNGSLDDQGYHLQKISTINTYVKPGQPPMAKRIQNLPIEKIGKELEMMTRYDSWSSIIYSEDFPEACKAHMIDNSMKEMWNRPINIGYLPVGILSLQFVNKRPDDAPPFDKDYSERLLEDLFIQIASIMKKRIISPGPVRKIADKVFGIVKI